MIRMLLGIVITSIVTYVWGFLIWGGVTPYQQYVLKQSPELDKARAALKEYFPENRTYLISPVLGDPEEVERRYQEGPVAFVHMISNEGKTAMDVNIMIRGFILNVICICLFACMLAWISPALDSYLAKVMFSAGIGLLVGLFRDIGDTAWWAVDWQWNVYNAFYTFTFFVICGLVLAAFVGSSGKAETNEA